MLQKAQVWEALRRRWARLLSLHDRAAMGRVLELTLDWNYEFYTTTMKVFVHGRPGKTDNSEWALPPLGMSLAKAHESLIVLRDRGILITEVAPNYAGLRFHPQIDYMLQPWEGLSPPQMPKLATPKRLKKDLPGVSRRQIPGIQDLETPYPHAGDPLSTSWRQYNSQSNTDISNNHPTQVSDRSRSRGADFLDEEIEETQPSSGKLSEAKGIEKSPREIFENHQAKSAAKWTTRLEEAKAGIKAALPGIKPSKKSDGSPGYPTGCFRTTDARVVWEDSWNQGIPGAQGPVIWSKAENKMMFDLFQTWPINADGSKPLGEFADFLAWVVANWSLVIPRKFGWMAKKGDPAPEFPSVTFLRRWIIEIQQAWMDRAKDKTMASGDLTMFSTLMAQGMSEKDAFEEIVSRKMKAREREKPRAAPIVRQRTRPLQPVATDRPLPPAEQPPTLVTPARKRRDLDAGDRIMRNFAEKAK